MTQFLSDDDARVLCVPDNRLLRWDTIDGRVTTAARRSVCRRLNDTWHGAAFSYDGEAGITALCATHIGCNSVHALLVLDVFCDWRLRCHDLSHYDVMDLTTEEAQAMLSPELASLTAVFSNVVGASYHALSAIAAFTLTWLATAGIRLFIEPNTTDAAIVASTAAAGIYLAILIDHMSTMRACQARMAHAVTRLSPYSLRLLTLIDNVCNW